MEFESSYMDKWLNSSWNAQMFTKYFSYEYLAMHTASWKWLILIRKWLMVDYYFELCYMYSSYLHECYNSDTSGTIPIPEIAQLIPQSVTTWGKLMSQSHRKKEQVNKMCVWLVSSVINSEHTTKWSPTVCLHCTVITPHRSQVLFFYGHRIVHAIMNEGCRLLCSIYRILLVLCIYYLWYLFTTSICS